MYYAIIACVQIIAETLPISSSSHVMLATLLLNPTNAPISEAFDHFLHGPMIIIMLVTFFPTWYPLTRKLYFSLTHKLTNTPLATKMLYAIIKKTTFLTTIALSSMPIAFLLKKHLTIALNDAPPVLSSSTLLIWGMSGNALILLSLIACKRTPKTYTPCTPCKAWIIGLVQACAFLLPGISRFGITYTTSRWLNLSPKRSFEFSFLIQLPLLIAAFCVHGIYHGIIHNESATREILMAPYTLTSIIAATILATLIFKKIYNLTLRQEVLWPFAFYLILPISALIMLK